MNNKDKVFNSWSLLYDEYYGETMINTGTAADYDKFWSQDMKNTVGGLGDDKIIFSSNGADDELTSGIDDTIPNLPNLPENNNNFWKYHEDVILKEVRDYLGMTYHSHYTSQESKTQTLDLIEGIGDAEPFCRSNAIKYLSRFGKKNGKSKQDILKAIHYCILLYHFAGLCNKNDSPYETF